MSTHRLLETRDKKFGKGPIFLHNKKLPLKLKSEVNAEREELSCENDHGKWHVHVLDRLVRMARAAIIEPALVVPDAYGATFATDRRERRVGAVQEPLDHERRGAVGDQAVALHLAQTQRAVVAPSRARLARDGLRRTARARVYLVDDLVLKHLQQNGNEKLFESHAKGREQSSVT